MKTLPQYQRFVKPSSRLTAYIGDYEAATDAPNVTLADNIESAVAWRSRPDLAQRIVVFIQNDSRKAHSLNEFTELTARDLARHLIDVAETELTGNEPQTQFWQALRDETANFPLPMLEQFVLAVAEQPDDPQAIIKHLWRLGLLRDEALLDRGQNITDRLQRNRELIEKMGQLSEQSRRRIGSVLAKVKGPEADPLRQALAAIKAFYNRGQVEVLGQLEFTTVQRLLEAGRPLPKPKPTPPPEPEPIIEDAPDDELLQEESADYDTTPPDRPLRGKELQKEVSNLAVSGDDEAQAGLQEVGDYLKERLQNPQDDAPDCTPSAGFNGQAVQPALPPPSLRQFIGYVCAVDRWGGILTSTRRGLKEAVFEATPEDVTPYNPAEPRPEHAQQSMFGLLRAFDDDLPTGVTFSGPLDRLVTAREKLLADLDLLLSYPIILFGGYPAARHTLTQYLDAYAELLRLFKDNEGTLHQIDATATRLIAAEMIRLDTVYVAVHGADEVEWKALLTPLHPLHLWRFREIFSAIHAGQRQLDQSEQTQLTAALPNLPHLLHYVVVSENVAANVVLPQAGSLENLPTYENHTNRYLGDDGLDLIPDLLKRWLDYAPYSRPQIRLALVDAPSLTVTLKAAAEFLKSKRRPRLDLHCYYTHQQNYQSELAQLDFDDRDHDLAELMRSQRLVIHLHAGDSLQAVLDELQRRPVHILYLFDQSQYQVDYGPRSRQLLVSPLVITYDYTYNQKFRRGVITPSSEAEDGVFAYYHFLVERAAHLPAGKQIRMQYNPEAELTPINTLLQTEGARWLAIADRVLTNYLPQNGVPIIEKRANRREIGVWSKVTDQAIKRFIDLLRRYNLKPDKQTVVDFLKQYGHLTAEGSGSLLVTGNHRSHDAQQKGLLGKLLAARWYTHRYPGALIASLDSSLALRWLHARSNSSERADLVGLRVDDGQLIIEPIEVKTRAGGAEVRIEPDPTTGRSRLAGHAVEQLQAVIATLKPIFGQDEGQPLFTPARREVLRYQLHRECFHEIHQNEWQARWYDYLQQAFAQPTPHVPLEIRGLLLHIRLEEGDDETVNDYPAQALTLARLGTQAIQRLVGMPVTEQLPPDAEEPTPASDSTLVTPAAPTVDNDVDAGIDVHPEAEALPASSADAALSATSAPVSIPEPDSQSDAPVPPSPEPAPQSPPEPKLSEAAEAQELARMFLRACQSYRIQIDSCDPARAVAGPNVWRFYVKPSRGQRLDALRNVLEDIGREMARSGVLISTLPNSQEIALDVPRLKSDRRIVPLAQGLAQLPAITAPEQMPVLLGVTPEGDDIIRDLGKMPHLMVGGTTGAGKTIFLYGLLISLLTSHPTPESLRLFLSTSKPEDFVFFNDLPHLEQGQVIADAEQAVGLLQSYVTRIFEERGAMLTAARCRDIGEYNAKHAEPLLPFVIIVDEFADLADQLAHDKTGLRAFYNQIRRVAQLGRNRGVHLVLCTQRPSADLVPTNIRNLMNVRVALRVNDGVASKMILDETGAEQLQMHGDLLFKEQARLTRAQGYYVASEELGRLLGKLNR